MEFKKSLVENVFIPMHSPLSDFGVRSQTAYLILLLTTSRVTAETGVPGRVRRAFAP
jgi:hypothetical protein